MSCSADNSKAPKLIDDLPENCPLRLEYLCIEFITNNHHVVFCDDQDETNPLGLQFHKSVFFPVILADELFEHFLLHSSLNPDRLINAFSNSSNCCLQKCRLRNLTISFDSIYNLCISQNIQVLDLSDVTLKRSNRNVEQLLMLCDENAVSFHLSNVKCDRLPKSFQFQHLQRDSHSSLRSIKMTRQEYAWYFVTDENHPIQLASLELSHFDTLKEPRNVLESSRKAATDFSGGYGDGSGCYDFFSAQNAKNNMKSTEDLIEKMDTMYDLQLDELPCSLLLLRYRLLALKDTLLSLSLFDTLFSEEDFETIMQLKNLRHLDIGAVVYTSYRPVVRPPGITVYHIIKELPDLSSLDVSATYIGDDLYANGKMKAITGERSLGEVVPRRLEFLGLCETEGCEVLDIYNLAKVVAGYHNEHQIMTSLQRYHDRPSILTSSFNRWYTMHRNMSLSCPHKMLRLILQSLQRYPLIDNLALTCTANLFFITRQDLSNYSTRQRNDLVLRIVQLIDLRQAKKMIIRNLLLILYHFKIPEHFLFQFGFITRTILKTLVLNHNNSEINGLAIHLCNVLVASMEHDMKKEVRKYNFIPIVVDFIKKKLDMKTNDEAMQVAWSAMWNVSDETPANSEEFIDLGGLELIRECMETFPEETEIHKNMMGLVGNISEVPHLRKHLMSPFFIDLLCKLLKETAEEDQDIEVSYNVCGTLSHLLSDGPAAWTCSEPSREGIIRDMFSVIESWKLDCHRSINYRSFTPILGLIDCDIPVCIHWALWALCNLSGTNRRYRRLLSEENGIEILSRVEAKDVLEKTKTFARMVIARVREYQEQEESDMTSLPDTAVDEW